MDNIQLKLRIQVEFRQIHESSFPLWDNYQQNPSLKDHANSTNPNDFEQIYNKKKCDKNIQILQVVKSMSVHINGPVSVQRILTHLGPLVLIIFSAGTRRRTGVDPTMRDPFCLV